MSFQFEMQLTTVCVPWTFVLLTCAFNSAVSYAIRNENADRFEKPNFLKPKYPYEPKMVRNEEQKKLPVEFGGDKKYEVISVRIDNNPSKVNMFTIVEGAKLMEEARLVSKSVRNKRSSYGGSNGMKRSHLARSHWGGGRGGPGGWYGRGPYGPWGPPGGPTPWAWGPPPWAWRPPPWAYWSSPWSPPPWAWGSPWSWGGQYNQSVPNQWATISPVNPTRPTQNQGINTGLPAAAATSPTVSKPAVPIAPTQGISTISPIMRPTMTTPGISPGTNQGMSTRPVMILTTTMPPTVTKPGASSAPIQGMTTRPPVMILTTTVPPTITRPGSSTTPQGMTLRPPLTTTPGQGTPQGSITTHLPGGQQLTPGQVTTRMPFKHGPIEPDIDYQPIESSGQGPTELASSPEKPDDEQNTKKPTMQIPSQNEQSSMGLGSTKGPVSQSGDGLRDPAPSMNLNGPSPEVIQDGQTEKAAVVPNVPLKQLGQDASPGHNQADPSQTERTGGQNEDGFHQELSQSETDNQDAVAPIDPRPTKGPEPIQQVDSNDQTPDGSMNSQENIPNSQIEQPAGGTDAEQSQQSGSPDDSSPSLGTDDQSKQDPQQPDQIGSTQPSVDPIKAVGSPEANNTPSNQIQQNGTPRQVDYRPAQGVDDESIQSAQEPGQAEANDQGPQGLTHNSTAGSSDEQITESSMDSAQEISPGSQREQAAGIPNTSSDQHQQNVAQGEADSSPSSSADVESEQDPQQPDQVGADNQSAQPSVDTGQTDGSPEVSNNPSNQIQSNGAPGQGEFSPTQGAGDESNQSPQGPSQAEPGDQGAQGLTDPSSADSSNEQVPEGSNGSSQETRPDGQREQVPDSSSTSSDQRQLEGSQGQVDSIKTQGGDESKQPPEQPGQEGPGDQGAQAPTDPNTSGSSEESSH